MSAAGAPTSITSRDNPLLVRLRKLAHDPGAYRRAGQVWLEGDHLGTALLARGGRALQAVLSEQAWADSRLRELASAAAPKVAVVPAALFEGISALPAPASIGFVVAWPTRPALLQPGAPTVVLDRVQDPGNVGSILRSAAAFGFGQVIGLTGTAAFGSPKVLRAGMGAHFGLTLVEGADAESLAALGVPLVATSSHAGVALPQAALPDACAWVFGHEGQGVAPALLARCALQVRIPQPGGEESLNVAAAAAVCLYETASGARRRFATKGGHERPI